MTQAQQEDYNERAGIMEYDGGLPRDDAEKVAAMYLELGN